MKLFQVPAVALWIGPGGSGALFAEEQVQPGGMKTTATGPLIW